MIHEKHQPNWGYCYPRGDRQQDCVNVYDDLDLLQAGAEI